MADIVLNVAFIARDIRFIRRFQPVEPVFNPNNIVGMADHKKFVGLDLRL
jgi:hypothetical protein